MATQVFPVEAIPYTVEAISKVIGIGLQLIPSGEVIKA
jgi:hypothetical protein